MAAIAVRCEGSRSTGWTCTVTLREGGLEISTHRVRVQADDLQRLALDASEPSRLVQESFRFLLEHEPPQMILRVFDLADIGRYCPEYEPDIRRRMGGPA
ncbi:MAG TPA: hypothetical protein VFI34_04035 [Candidatus Limnocylindrales bacterium]|nr:hypothetical protein [Candidatus Limnocylindrales bacterium]